MSVLDATLKIFLAFVIITVYMKVSANSQLAPLTASDQVGNIVLGALVGGTLAEEVSILILVVSIVLWCALQLFLRWAKFHSSKLTSVIDGKRIQLVKNGKLLIHGFEETKLLPEDFLLSLHKKGIHSLEEVWNAWYETDGTTSADKKDEQMLSEVLISNGTIIDGALESIDKTENWLCDMLEKRIYVLKIYF